MIFPLPPTNVAHNLVGEAGAPSLDSCTVLGRTFSPFAPAAMPLRCEVVSCCQRSHEDVFTPFSEAGEQCCKNPRQEQITPQFGTQIWCCIIDCMNLFLLLMYNLTIASHLCQEATYFKARGGIAVPIETNHKIPKIRKLIQFLWMELTKFQEF